MLEYFVRQDLDSKVKAVMTVKDPLKVIITNYDDVEYVEGHNHPKLEEFGSREIPFTREIYIEREDFTENPPKKFKRLSPGEEVRLRHAYFIRCNEVIKDNDGNIIELKCTYDPETKSGSGFTGRKPKGTIHWVSASHSKHCVIREFDDLFLDEPNEEKLIEQINQDSKVVFENAYVEEAGAKFIEAGEERFQFVRHGFFYVDPKLSDDEKLVFNRVVGQKVRYKK